MTTTSSADDRPSGPPESDPVRTATLAVAAQGARAVADRYPDLELEHDPGRDDRWYDCTAWVVEPPGDTPPERIQWLSSRRFSAAPPRPTEPLVDAVIGDLTAAGWDLEAEVDGDAGRDVTLRKDGFALTVGGTPDVREGQRSSLLVSVSSPCVDAPAGLGGPD